MRISRKQHEENLRKYVELCSTGMTYIEMAKIIGVHPYTIRTYKEKTGVSKRDNKEQKEETLNRIKEMYLSGMTLPDISSCLGINPRVIASYKYQLGLTDKTKEHKKVKGKEYYKIIMNNLKAMASNVEKQ